MSVGEDMRYFATAVQNSAEIKAIIGSDYKVYIGAHDKDFSNLPLPNIILYPREIELGRGETDKQFIYFIEAAIAEDNHATEVNNIGELTGQIMITDMLEAIADLMWRTASCTNAYDVSIDTAVNPAIQDRVYSGSVSLRYKLNRVIGGGFMPLRS
jgi:hypothetical protein